MSWLPARNYPSSPSEWNTPLSTPPDPTRMREVRALLARVAPKSPGNIAEGFVLTFDDMTALASAQFLFIPLGQVFLTRDDACVALADANQRTLVAVRLSNDGGRLMFKALALLLLVVPVLAADGILSPVPFW